MYLAGGSRARCPARPWTGAGRCRYAVAFSTMLAVSVISHPSDRPQELTERPYTRELGQINTLFRSPAIAIDFTKLAQLN